jgi:hypothetical protein
VVLVFVGIAGYMTLKGLFGAWRAAALDPVALRLDEMGWPDQGLGTVLSRATGWSAKPALLAAMAICAVPLLAFTLRDARFRTNRWQLGGGLVIGLVIVAGWYLSGHIGFGENPETLENVFFATNSRTIESLSFIAPLAYGMELLMLWTDQSLHLSMGISATLGMALGAAGAALSSGRFRWEGFASLGDLRDQLIGAVLMGFGGVTALGCTVGQGLSGLSTLAIGSFIATAGIVAGCVATLKFMVWREG